jgi:hypothetical protein
LSYIPIIYMDQQHVISTLRQAKIYIDLGAHPGRDRIPREAAMHGCVVIVSFRGAARNDLDMPIPMTNKIPNGMTDEEITSLIHQYMVEYEYRIEDMNEYREWIRAAESRFAEEIQEIWS